MNIKVCGITQIKQLHQLEGLQIDFAGLIFYKQSPRYMRDKISAKELKQADLDIKLVGVFVNEAPEIVIKTALEYGLDMVQLHGSESPEDCETIMEEVEVIKAFQLTGDEKPDKLLKPYDEVCDYYLFDTAAADAGYGGTGKKFDWKILSKSKIEKPFFLSGGIGLDDVGNIIEVNHPDFFSVDINSKFEISPGVKDMISVLKFKKALG